MNVKKEFEKSLEKMITKHIELHTQRNLPTVKPVYDHNMDEIYKLATEYGKLFNKSPRVEIYELSFYLKGKK